MQVRLPLIFPRPPNKIRKGSDHFFHRFLILGPYLAFPRWSFTRRHFGNTSCQVDAWGHLDLGMTAGFPENIGVMFLLACDVREWNPGFHVGWSALQTNRQFCLFHGTDRFF